MSAEEEKYRRVYVNVVRSQTEKGNKRKNVYAARRSRKPKIEFHVNTTKLLYSADINYFGTRKIINSHGFGDLFPLFRILLCRALQAH